MNGLMEIILNPRSISTIVLAISILIAETICRSRGYENASPELKELKEIRFRLVLIWLLIFCK